MRFIAPKIRNVGDWKEIEPEKALDNIKFKIYKFNNRKKPTDKRKICFISCFSEFGCETIGILYCLPSLLRSSPGYYTIALGWHGREYFYRHLVDEFWEIGEEYQWLREYCRAFHHESKNLKKLEKAVEEYGTSLPSSHLSKFAVGNHCYECNEFWQDSKYVEECRKCKSTCIRRSLLGDMEYHKKYTLIKLPEPSQEKIEYAKSFIKSNSVGVFARYRKCYGRNLQPEFYLKLINLLEEFGYNIVWLGEKQTTLPCPKEGILDFSRKPESQDLETTLAIIKQLNFTIQFWTASTRLSGMMGVPYLLFESPDQIFGKGQEGYRLNLSTFGEKKLVYSHFLNVYNDNDKAIELVKKSILEMQEGNYNDIIGMVDSELCTKTLKELNMSRLA